METFIKRIALIVAMLLTISDFAMAEPHAYAVWGNPALAGEDIGQDVAVGVSARLPWAPYYPDNPTGFSTSYKISRELQLPAYITPRQLGNNDKAKILIIFDLCKCCRGIVQRFNPLFMETDNTPPFMDEPVPDYLDVHNPFNYILIGCDLYFVTYRVDARGHLIRVLIRWKFGQLRKDLKADEICRIRRFIGMGCYPDHIHYQSSWNGMFNTYSPLPFQPCYGEWPTIKKTLQHIFGEHYEYGMDYLQLLYLNPTQTLPILLLVSEERNTGKTTFLNLLKEMFGSNMAFVTNETLRSPFNGERASQLIVACDETFLNRREDSEKLKNLSTAKTTYIEYKGRDRYEIDNFAKIILCSNNIVDPVYIDAREVRYWVREVPVLTDDNPNVLDTMKREIPAFMDFLLHRSLFVPEARSRMWFRMEDLRTDALARIVRACRPTSELELAETLLDLMDQFGVDVLRYTASDLTCVLRTIGRDIKDAHRIVCKQWHVPQALNKHAYDLRAPFVERPEHRFGRYYTFHRAFLEGLLPGYITPATSQPPEEQEGQVGNLFSSQ